MKFKVVLSAIVLSVIFAAMLSLNLQQKAHAADGKILYYTCSMHPDVKSDKPGACPKCGMPMDPVFASDDTVKIAATNSVPDSAAKPVPYPLKTCVVSGEKLGEMGKPIEFIYTNNGANQEIKFCCPMCKPQFLQDPDKYMKIIKAAETNK